MTFRPSKRTRPSEATVSGRRLLVAVLLSVGLAVAAGLVTPAVLRGLAPSWTAIDTLAAVITAEVYLAVLVGHLVAFGGWAGLRDRLRLKPLAWRDVVLAAAVVIVVWVAATALYVGLNPLFGWLEEIRDTLLWIGADGGRLERADAAVFAIAIARACLLAPLCEEVLFRGSLFGWLRRRASGPVTIAATAALFAVIHQMPIVFPLTVLFGLGSGWLREHTGSLTPAVVSHVLNNAALVTLAYLLTGWHVSESAPT